MGDLRRRLSNLEGTHAELLDERGHPGRGETESQRDDELWCMEVQWTALHLVRGLEPSFTLDERSAFWTLDGRFAVSPWRVDLRAIMGPRTEELVEKIPPERWTRFLVADVEAAEFLDRLLKLGEDAAVPEDYEPPMHSEWTLEQLESFKCTYKPTAIFKDASEKEAVRRLTYTFVNNSDVRRMFSELTRRRDAYAATLDQGEGEVHS